MRPARPTRPAATNSLPGIIDTLTGGFDHVNRVLWIILIPIALDLFLWLTPQWSAAPFLHDVVRSIGSFYTQYGNQVADPTTADQMQQAIAALNDGVNGFNLWTLLVASFAGVPSIAPPTQAGPLAFQIRTSSGFLLAFVGLELVGTILGCLYLGLLAQQVRNGKVSLVALARRLPLYVGSVIGFVLLAVGVALLVFFPIMLAIGVARLIAPGAGVFLSFLGLLGVQVVGLLSVIYLFFLVDAIVVSDAGPIRAARNSASIVASNFWGTLGFIIVFVVITWGLGLVWLALSKNTLGMIAAILGNAYVASGLAAASMHYYQARISRLSTSSVGGRVIQV